MSRTFKKVVGDYEFLKLEVGESVQGIYKRDIVTKSKDKKFSDGCAYLISVEGKEKLQAISGSGKLNYLMNLVEKDEYVRITYLGKEEVEGYKDPLHQYELEIAE